MKYFAARLLRRVIPEQVINLMMSRRFLLSPGLETSNPEEATRLYETDLKNHGMSLREKEILVFGYGGFFGIAASLLARGAKHVFLYDKFTPPSDRKNKSLLKKYQQHFNLVDNKVIPLSSDITLIHDDLEEWIRANKGFAVDIVLSSSVFEHVDPVDQCFRVLATITRKDGIQLHYIDLRDHYFQYPFNMLFYTDSIWKSLLNPKSNLNRYRLSDYERIVSKYFSDCSLIPTSSDPEQFSLVKSKIQKNFLSGDDNVDSILTIRVVLKNPLLAPLRQ